MLFFSFAAKAATTAQAEGWSCAFAAMTVKPSTSIVRGHNPEQDI